MSDEELGSHIDNFMAKIHTDKIYIENHRGLIAADGITCTTLVDNIRKPAIFDTYCYTDPAHRKEALKLFKDLASVFDEIILDDFFHSLIA